jgi:hypothetical protein
VVLAALYLLAARQAAGEAGLPLDDAWIHARIARNLGEGRGFVFNAGESAAASSAPLWTLLLALPAAAGLPFPWASYVIGIASAVGLALVAGRLAHRATGERAAGLLGGLLTVGTHPFPWSSLSGMETPLAAALVLATILAALSGRTEASLGLAAAAGCARPELVLLPGLVFADFLARTRPLRVRRALAVALGSVAAGAAPFLFNRALTGRWLFGSFEAKVGRHGVLAALAEGRADLVPGIVASNLAVYLVPLCTALARDNGALLLLAPLGFWRVARGERRTHLPWMIGLLLPSAVAVLAPFGGPAYHEQRYVASSVAAVLISGCAGLFMLPSPFRGRRFRALAITLVIGMSAWGTWQGLRRYALEVKNITEMQVRVGRWLSDRPGGPGMIATQDIGAIGFFTGAPIVDLTGLVSPDAIPYLRRKPPPGGANRGWNGASEAGLQEFLRARRPSYVALFPSWYPSRFFQESLGRPVLRVDLADNLICGDRTMIVYQPVWEEAVPGGG